MSHHRYTSHHHPPSSRGGTETVELPKCFHESWHTVFQNLKRNEVLTFAKRFIQLMDKQDKITAKQLHDLRQEVINDD